MNGAGGTAKERMQPPRRVDKEAQQSEGAAAVPSHAGPGEDVPGGAFCGRRAPGARTQAAHTHIPWALGPPCALQCMQWLSRVPPGICELQAGFPACMQRRRPHDILHNSPLTTSQWSLSLQLQDLPFVRRGFVWFFREYLLCKVVVRMRVWDRSSTKCVFSTQEARSRPGGHTADQYGVRHVAWGPVQLTMQHATERHSELNRPEVGHMDGGNGRVRPMETAGERCTSDGPHATVTCA